MYTITTFSKRLLADTLTPVNIYLKLRDVYAGSILLESSDYHGHENSLSFICCQPIASFQVQSGKAEFCYPDGSVKQQDVNAQGKATQLLENFRKSFDLKNSELSRLPYAGLFGYMAYDAIQYFEEIELQKSDQIIPDILYKMYQYVIVVDHFSNEISLFENRYDSEDEKVNPSLDRLEQLIFSNRFSTFRFHRIGEEQSNFTDEEFLRVIEKGKEHCYRGDVFQIVLSRRFSCSFKGDEFNVYRALRSVNPSPYLFYFDYGSFKIFGSSPEAQLQVKEGKAAIFPIAGTFKRSGNDQEDAEQAARLSEDEKENAEHIMLVDLARNDMSRHAGKVTVEVFKEIQYYSHVIHLVSKVSGVLGNQNEVIQMAADTFPAGTLSGAPKHKAMTLINQFENVNRGFYGGAIGVIGLEGSFNHAIMIRTFLSRNNSLTYQAGAGVVSKSKAESELQEVNNKLEALRKSIKMAEAL